MASPTFCCGFECGASGAHWTLTGAITFDTTIKRTGNRSLRIQNAAAGANATFAIAGNIAIIRCYLYFSSLPAVDVNLVSVYNSTTHLGGARFESSDGKIYARSALNDGSTGILIMVDRWYRIDIKVNTSNNPWTTDVSVDGDNCGQATNPVAATSYDAIFLHRVSAGSSNYTGYCDDLILSQTLADYPIGNGLIQPYTVTSDGTHNIAGGGDFQRGNTAVDILNATTTAFQLIDDVPLPSGAVDEADNWRGVAPANAATDYVEGLFGPASGVPTPKVAPRAVEVILAHHQISTTVGQMQVRLNDNGTLDTTFDTGAAAGVTTYRYARKHYASGPAGAWVIGGGGNGDFTDLRVRFLAQDANPDQCLDAIMIEAEFPEPKQKVVSINQAVNRSNTY